MVRAFQQYLRADVERSRHHVANLVRDERIAAREEALRGPHQRDRTTHAAHLFGCRAGGGHGRRVLFCCHARGFGPVAALDLPEIVEIVICEVLGKVFHREVLVGEPEIEVSFRAFEGHVQALEGPREALLQRGGLLSLFGHLFCLALDAGPSAVEQDEGAHAVGEHEGRLQGYEAAHGVPCQDGALQTEVVEDADHVSRMRFEAVSRLGFVRVATAAQVNADEATRRSQVACRCVEGPVLGSDAVQADYGVWTFPGAAKSEFHLARYAFVVPETLYHGRELYAKASEGWVMVIYRNGLFRERARGCREHAPDPYGQNRA